MAKLYFRYGVMNCGKSTSLLQSIHNYEDRGLEIMLLKPRNDLDLKKYILNNYQESEHGVAYYILTDEIQKELGIETEQGKESINIFANIDGINAWVSATEDVEDPVWKWRISLRSKITPINEVASHFHGGGHENASGAKLKKIEELPALIKELDNLFIK